MVVHSATLAIDQAIRARKAAGEQILHLGFGEAGLPVLPTVANVLAQNTGHNAYGTVVGAPSARRAAAGYFDRRGLPTDPDQLVYAPGSKALLYAVIASLPGDVVLPRPSWVSYAAQAALAHKHVIDVPIAAEAGGVPDPAALDARLTEARANGRQPGVLVLTLPDNPTGTLAPADLVREVCAVAAEHDLVILSDEIYRDLAYDPSQVLSPALVVPERTVVTTGLSKSMALGGWRIGVARLPESPRTAGLRDAIVGVASEVWSSLAGPMQDVAAYVFAEPSDVTEHVAASRQLHRAVATAVYDEFVAAGATCRPPTGAFYLYPDLERQRDWFATQGAKTGADAAAFLLDRYGVGVLAGEAFGDEPDALRFRVATSLLYGETADQRWEALRSADPLRLPWIAASLGQLREVLAKVGTKST